MARQPRRNAGVARKPAKHINTMAGAARNDGALTGCSPIRCVVSPDATMNGSTANKKAAMLS
jgi:hypothetical protein